MDEIRADDLDEGGFVLGQEDLFLDSGPAVRSNATGSERR
jgi:hypothetical protein